MSLLRVLSAAYALLLRAFPRGHRSRYLAEMVDAFARELSAVRQRAGTAAALRFAMRGYLDAVLAGAGERRRGLRRSRIQGVPLGLGADLLHAVRSLSRSWTYSLVCLLSLAAGLGVTAAVLLLLRVTMQAPFEIDQEGLVEVLAMEAGAVEGAWSYPDFLDLEAAVEAADLVAWTLGDGSVRPDGADAGARAGVAYVSGGYFDVLRLEPALGRFPGEHEEAAGPAPVVVAHAFWKTSLASDSGVVGRVLTVNRTPHVVVGVAPEWFRHHDTRLRADVWVPLETHPALAVDGGSRHDRAHAWLDILGRVRPGSAAAQVEGAARSVVAGLAEAHPATHAERGVGVLPWHWQGARFVSDDGTLMGTLFGMMCAFLLLVVCLNLAGMGMVRSASRERELALRLAIGSSRRRLVQVLMAESLVLATAGGALVVGVAWAMLRIVSWRYAVPLPASAQVDLPVIALCMAVALGTSLVFGLAPALRFSRPGLLAAIKDDSGIGGRRSGLFHRLGAALQAGLAVPVLVVAVGVTQAAMSMGQADFGVREEGLVVWMPSDLAADGYDAAGTERLARDLVRELEALPGAEVVAAADGMPLDGRPRPVTVESPDVGTSASARVTRVGPGYLEALGVPLLRGRSLVEEDVPGAEPVAVVSATVSQALWGDADPLGRRLTVGDPDGAERVVTIVGVAADFAGQWVGGGMGHVLMPLAQEPSTVLGVAVRAVAGFGTADALTASVERIALEIDPELAKPHVASFPSIVEVGSAEIPVWGAFFGALAILLLLLSALGIYGVVAFTFASRTREIGVRMSLGSSRAGVLRMVLWDGARVAAPGLLLGSAAGAAVAALVVNQIFVDLGLPVTGTGTVVAAVLAALAAVLLASLLPAQRAASVDPLEALRSE